MSGMPSGIDAAIAAIAAIRIVPVVTIEEPDSASELVAALQEGGVGCAELTLRTEGALAAIEIAARRPGFVVGAGTVLTAQDVDRSVDAGASFIVSPGYDEDVVERAQARGVAVIPGIATATELQRAVAAGLTHVKFFPASSLGGPKAIAALSAPFPGVRFMPSGGIGVADAAGYLAVPSVFAVGGGWLTPVALLRERAWGRVRELAEAAVAAIVA